MNPSRRQFITRTIAGAAAFQVLSRGALAGATQPNIVFMLSDDHSAGDLGCYGNTAIQTPNLDALAGRGMRFDRAYVTSPQCSPSRASILTGRTPHAIGASRLHVDAFADTPGVPRALQSAGYFTGALRKVHQGHLQQTFDYYGGAAEPFARFFEVRPKDRPFFLWFGSIDPHRDYAPGACDPPHEPEAMKVPDFLADTPETRQDLALYYDEIARFDRECGELMALLDSEGLAENTLIIMAGDNGMPFPRAKATLYEPGVRVPMLAAWPGVIAPGGHTRALVSLMDLARTWIDAADAPVPDSMEGQSLTPLFRGDTDAVREMLFTERNWHDNWDPMRSVITDRYKLIRNYRPDVGYLPSLDLLRSPSYAAISALAEENRLDGHLAWYRATDKPPVELYDLETDPGEWNNLGGLAEHAPRVAALNRALGQWMNDTKDFLPPPAAAYGPAHVETLNGGVTTKNL